MHMMGCRNLRRYIFYPYILHIDYLYLNAIAHQPLIHGCDEYVVILLDEGDGFGVECDLEGFLELSVLYEYDSVLA